MKNILITLLFGVLIASCTEDDISIERTTDNVIELTLRFPQMENQVIGSRSVAIPEVDDLWTVFCGPDGKVRSKEKCDLTKELEKILSEGVTCYKLRLTVPDGTATVSLVANASSELETVVGGDELTDISFKQFPIEETYIPMYGVADLATLQSTIKPQISLERIIAKTTVAYSPEKESGYDDLFADFEIIGVEGFDFAVEGWLVPVDPLNESTETATLGLNYEKTEFYTYETSYKNASRLVLKTNKGYYPVDYLNNKGETIDIVRNHNYVINVTRVNAMGYSSEAEALNAPAENRLSVVIEDYHEEIYNMIACKDYELGVCDDVVVSSTTETAIVSVVATMIPGMSDAIPMISWNTDADSWVKSSEIKSIKDYSSIDYNSDGKLYTIEFSLDGNVRSQNPRNAEITVSYGDLERKVSITQEGHNFFRDDNRIVLLQHLENATDESTIAYFEFVDNTLHGVTPEQNGGRIRNSGLHFSTIENHYTYYIPYLEGDRLTMPSNPKFTVSDRNMSTPSGRFWVVSLNDNNPVSDTWTSYFTITNGDGIDIVYDVYRTGIFHHISSISHLLDNSKIGWYYYEQVKSSDGVVMLDRNLGADCNQFYTFSVSSLAQYAGSVGAYYRISASKEEGIVASSICPEGFTVPDNMTLESLGIEARSMSVSNSQTYYSYVIQATGADGQMQNVYVPVSGYYEGDIHKNLAHACLWTSSPLSGNQGFSTKSPEYKYWYIYLDINGRSVKMSNMRFVNGSAGQSMESGYKYMPVRCVINKGYAPGGMRKIYYTNPNNWETVYAHYWGNDDTTLNTTWPGEKMEKGSDGKWELSIPKGATMIVFNNGNGVQTDNITISETSNTYSNKWE